jgi:Secretion system C-terminal sorting domain
VDSTNWVKVEGWFTADDSYNWVAIGNFFQDDQTIVLVQNSGLQCNAIYYLENICISANPADCDYLTKVNQTATLETTHLFPNPVAETLRISNPNHSPIIISIYDSFGNAIFNEESNNEIFIPSDSWTKGFYCVVLTDKSNSIRTFKILKE